MKCDICGTNEATRHYLGFVYEDVCDYWWSSPDLWFPDKPAYPKPIKIQTSLFGFIGVPPNFSKSPVKRTA